MEEQNITYTGITQATSDLDCRDGDLSLSHNIISQNEAMRPILLPEAQFTMGEDEQLVYVHSTAGYKNYLYTSSGQLKAFRLESGQRTDYDFAYDIGTDTEVNQIQSIGNTLVAYTSDGKTAYLLYKEGNYLLLGNELPEVYLQFGLTGRTRLFSYSDESKATFKITFDSIQEANIYEPFSEENQVKITEQVMAKVNRFVSEQTTEKGMFCFPFFVRYALRLYDGSLVKHSAPILMMPSTTIAPVVMWNRIKGKGSYTEAEMDIMLVAASLNYRVIPTSGATDLKNHWTDIVKSIDFFISSPIYTYDTGGMCTGFNDTDNFDSSFIGRLVDFERFRAQTAEAKWEDAPFMPITGLEQGEDGSFSYPFKGKFLEFPYRQLYGLMYSTDRTYPSMTLSLPEKDTDQVREDILNQSLFYLAGNVKLENLEWLNTHELDISDSYLANMTLKERMMDDWQTHDRLQPAYSYMYNQRLNIANVERTLYDGFPALSMLCKKETVHNYTVDEATHELNIDPNVLLGSVSDMDVYTYIHEDNRDIVVKSSLALGYYAISLAPFVSLPLADGEGSPTGEYQRKCWPSFLYYPNPNAYKMVLVDEYSNRYEITLQEHESLNGAYALLDFDSVMLSMEDVQFPSVSADKTVDMPNKIYTSEAANPFYFPLGGINTVGTGEIVGISSTTRALSQGQFGQFPLLVFATDGIWAMEVSDTGLYSVRQPISRDVCSNPHSITQTDGAVVFVSDKGVMVADGSRVDMLSAELDGPSFSPQSVARLSDILSKEGLTEELGQMGAAKDFFQLCRVAYDYPNAKLIFFIPDKKIAWVYSLNSRTWATMTGGITQAVTDYPGCYVQMADGAVINISTKQDFDDTRQVKTLLLTRPLKLGDVALKTVNTILLRGLLPAKEGAVIVFASHDGLRYVPIGSAVGIRLSRLQGSPYRYFRLCVVRKMDTGQSLSAASVYLTRKWRNKPR